MNLRELGISRNGRALIAAALVFLILAGFIGIIYAAFAFGLGMLAGETSLWHSLIATAFVAVAFEPLRVRVSRWANRVVHGDRATPYEALSEITRRLTTAESEEGLFDRMAGMLVAGTGADRATVWLAEGRGFTSAAAAPAGPMRQATDAADLPGDAVLIQDGAETVGALTLETTRGDSLTPTERALVADLAGSAALVIRKLRLDADLAAKARELQDSRRRLVDAQDVERRRLERDLHDGAQQQVVALKVKLGLVRQLAAREGMDRTVGLIDQMADDTQRAVDQIRSLARGIYPPLLQADGLAAAIPAVTAVSTLDVIVENHLTGRHPLALEGAVYFCVSEALANAAKHAGGPVTVSISDQSGFLSFEVTDSGPGFDVAARPEGAGLRNMADRLDTLGGSLEITSTPGGGTTVSGRLPLSTAAGESG